MFLTKSPTEMFPTKSPTNSSFFACLFFHKHANFVAIRLSEPIVSHVSLPIQPIVAKQNSSQHWIFARDLGIILQWVNANGILKRQKKK
jgi:hypothetical protein